jgi:hypothetical protein
MAQRPVPGLFAAIMTAPEAVESRGPDRHGMSKTRFDLSRQGSQRIVRALQSGLAATPAPPKAVIPPRLRPTTHMEVEMDKKAKVPKKTKATPAKGKTDATKK